jgi:O-Antigen ligase
MELKMKAHFSVSERCFLFFTFLAFFLEDPVGRPYYQFDPPTEILGNIFFRTLSSSLKLPGMTISPFEIFSYLLFFHFIFKYRISQFQKNWKTPAFYTAISLAVLMPMSLVYAAAAGAFFGELKTSFLIVQGRTFPLIGMWIYLGFELSKKKDLIFYFFNIIVICLGIKSVVAFYAYFFELQGISDTREYLIDHITSDFMTTAWVFLISSIIFMKGKTFWKSIYISICLIMLAPYIWNERRSATLGMIFFIGILFCLIKKDTYIKAWKFIAAGIACFLCFLAVTWNAQGALGSLARTLKSSADTTSDNSTQYRLIENFNLLSVVGSYPLTGAGFGKRFPLVVKLADISEVYDLFDVVPHNTVLLLWAFAGPLGLAAFGTLIAAGIGIAFNVIRKSHSNPQVRILSLVAMAVTVKWLVFVFADMALLELRSVFIFGICVGLLVRYSYTLDWQQKNSGVLS